MSAGWVPWPAADPLAGLSVPADPLSGCYSALSGTGFHPHFLVWATLWRRVHNGDHTSSVGFKASESYRSCGKATEGESIGAHSPRTCGASQTLARAGIGRAGPARVPEPAATRGGVSHMGGRRGVAGDLSRGDVCLYRF